MKLKLFAAAMMIAGLFPLATIAQTQKKSEITGHIKGLKEGERILFKMNTGKGFTEGVDTKLIDSVKVKNGVFHIAFAVDRGPRLYSIEFDQHPVNICRFLISAGEKIEVSSDIAIDSIPHNYLDNSLMITGSSTNTAWQTISINYRFTNQILRFPRARLYNTESTKLDKCSIADYIMFRESINKNLYANFFSNPDSRIEAVIPMFIDGEGIFEVTGHSPIWIPLYNGWPDSVKKSYYGQELNKHLPLSIGEPLPAFSLPTPEGKLITLNDALPKQGLLIIEFWSTQSVLRAEYQDELRHQFEKYHSKGLNVIGISSDTVDYQWKGFVAAQKFPWPNISDLKGKNGVVGKLYFEFGSPESPNTTNVLLDAKGKIIAWDINGVELEYYLSKYLN